MRKLSGANLHYPKGSEPGEVKHLSTLRKRNQRDSLSSGERNGNSPNHSNFGSRGVVGRTIKSTVIGS